MSEKYDPGIAFTSSPPRIGTETKNCAKIERVDPDCDQIARVDPSQQASFATGSTIAEETFKEL